MLSQVTLIYLQLTSERRPCSTRVAEIGKIHHSAPKIASRVDVSRAVEFAAPALLSKAGCWDKAIDGRIRHDPSNLTESQLTPRLMYKDQQNGKKINFQFSLYWREA